MYVSEWNIYLKDIAENDNLKELWISYREKYPYAVDIEYQEIIDILKYVLE